MARWDEILTLPVQNPPTLEFSSADIVWSRVEGWRETVDRVALIPFTRVNDFVRGESNSKECPTRFHVEARRRRSPEMPYKPKVDGILEYILYWCSFGPDDHRKGGVVRPSRNYSAKRKTPAGRPNTKRGCVCHFIVKRLIAEPSVALIIYNHEKHVDKQGSPCHGPQDKKAVGTRAMFAPYISEELRLQVMSLLYVGVPVETIMQRHTEIVDKQGGPSNRDDLLTHRYVRRLERKIRRSTFELDTDDAVSLAIWIETHQNHVFFYEDFSDTEPFVLGIQTEWQLQQMIRFGNRSLVASDSSFGSNKLKYPVHSLLVFDANNNAIPVAWIITPRFAGGDMHRWLRALYDRVHSKDPNWKLGGFIIDDPSADVHTISDVFQCSVLICFWRMRHSWHKNLMERCSATEMCVEILRQLGKAISSICREDGNVDLFEDFLEDFVDCSDFLDYFKAIWFPRLGTWTAALKTLPLATVETSAAIECYHHQLKLRLLNEKDPSVYQREDWLADKLGTKVHSYYWLDEFVGKANFARYWKDEWKSGLTSWRQAIQIPDSDVIVHGKYAEVISQKQQDKIHTVWNPGSGFALCECSWSRMGNLCKHAIKASIVYHKRGLSTPSVSLFEYHRTLTNILHCPPHDSLIHDHAVALAVCVQMQLDALFDSEKSCLASSISVPGEHQTDGGLPALNILENSDKDLMNEGLSVDMNVDLAGETITRHLMDAGAQPAETSPSESLPMEKEMTPDNSLKMDSGENGARDSLNERMVSDTNNSNSSTSTSGPLADSFETIHTNEDVGLLKNDGGASKDVSVGAVTGKTTNTDLEPIHTSPSASMSQVPNDSRVDGCTSQVSYALASGMEICDVVEKCTSDSMTIGTIKDDNAICNDSAKQAGNGNDFSEKVAEKASIDLITNCESTESEVADAAENGCNQATTNKAAAVDKSGCGSDDGAGADMEINGCCNSSEQEAVGSNTIINVAKIISEGSSGAAKGVHMDQMMDVTVTCKISCNDDMEQVGIDQMSEIELATNGVGVMPPEEIGNGALLTPIIGRGVDSNTEQGVNPDAKDNPVLMDIEFCADPAEEARSAVDEHVGVDVSGDADEVSNGHEEKSGNGLGNQNTALLKCSTSS